MGGQVLGAVLQIIPGGSGRHDPGPSIEESDKKAH